MDLSMQTDPAASDIAESTVVRRPDESVSRGGTGGAGQALGDTRGVECIESAIQGIEEYARAR
eukprot:1192587-Prorocentrum_minimum.AAC.5